MKTQCLILLLYVTAVLSDTPNDDLDISGDTHPFVKIGRKYYIVFNGVKMNWFAAANLCQTYNSDLATIDSATELNYLNSYLVKNGHLNKLFWISGNDLAEEGQFVSLSTGRPMIYMKFATGQPDNYKDEDCVNFQTFTETTYMNDLSCSELCHPICEMRRAPKTYIQDEYENISTKCTLKTLIQEFLRAENTFNCRA